MGNGSMTLEYPYETNQGHYPLWKPPSNYYPRGEAPPPYEEAIALAQSEAAINTCTVSVATTTHRTLPMNVCQNPEDNGITTNTTNLINININNAGTITSVAAGENHQIANGNANSNTQPRSTQTTNAGQMTTSTDNGRNTTVSVCAYTNQSQLTEMQNNHPLTPSRLSMCNNSRCQVPKEVQTVSLNQQQNAKALEAPDYSNGTTTILPPPLFDGNGNSSGISPSNNCGVLNRHNISTPSSSRRYHRTIPRHFQSVDPIMSSLKPNEPQSKKPTCQCPVQHVPMSYMGSTHFTQQAHTTTSNNSTLNSSSSNGIYLSKLNNTNKQVSNNSNSNGSKSLKYGAAIETNSINNNNNNSNTLRRVKHLQNSQLNNSPSSLTIASGSNLSSNHNHSSASSQHQKIPTISKQVVTPTLDLSNAPVNSSSLSNPSSTSLVTSNHIHSILKNKSNNLLTASTTSLKLLDATLAASGGGGGAMSGPNSIKSTDILNPPFPIPFIDSKTTNDTAAIMDSNHPVLPPKMYKNNNNNKHYSYATTNNNSNHNNSNNSNTQKIHTISKSQIQQAPGHHQQYPMITQQMRSNSMRMSFPNHNQTINGHNTNFNTKSLRRNNNNGSHNSNNNNNSHHNNDNSNIILLKNSEKSQSLVKINASIGFPANHITYSLPKPANNTGKLSLRTSITDVVSKVPSVITIPSPSSTTSATVTLQANSLITTTSAPAVVAVAAAAATTSTTASSASTLTKIITTSMNPRNPNNLTLPTGNAITNALNNNSHMVNHFLHHQNHNNNHVINSPSSSTPLNNSASLSPKPEDKPLPVCTTSKNCSNPKEHFLPNDTSLDDDYLSECENCKSAHGSRYYLDEEIIDSPQETMTLQRKPTENEEEHDYYRTSQTLPTNTKQKTTTIKNREPWFQTIPASSSSDEEINE